MTVIACDNEAISQKERTGPWLVESVILFLELFLNENRNCRILETGMGASTIWFEKRCRFIVSIEHDKDWYHKLFPKITGSSTVNARGAEKGMVIPTPYANLHLCERPYNIIIEKEENESFDVILIDGRDRVKCIQSSIPKLKSGGWLIVDNSERPYYQKGMDLMKDWNRIDCKQNRPDKYDFTYPDWTTSIFIKP